MSFAVFKEAPPQAIQSRRAPTTDGRWYLRMGPHWSARYIAVDRADGGGTVDVAVMVPVPPEDEREARANELALLNGPAMLRELEGLLQRGGYVGLEDFARVRALVIKCGGAA